MVYENLEKEILHLFDENSILSGDKIYTSLDVQLPFEVEPVRTILEDLVLETRLIAYDFRVNGDMEQKLKTNSPMILYTLPQKRPYDI